MLGLCRVPPRLLVVMECLQGSLHDLLVGRLPYRWDQVTTTGNCGVSLGRQSAAEGDPSIHSHTDAGTGFGARLGWVREVSTEASADAVDSRSGGAPVGSGRGGGQEGGNGQLPPLPLSLVLRIAREVCA